MRLRLEIDDLNVEVNKHESIEIWQGSDKYSGNHPLTIKDITELNMLEDMLKKARQFYYQGDIRDAE